MQPRTRTAVLVAGLAGAVAIGAVVGARTYSVLEGGEPSVGSIYDRTHRGVVEITTTATTKPPLPPEQQHAQGSGWVYDERGDVVTDQHVVASADPAFASGTARSTRRPSSAATLRRISRWSSRHPPRSSTRSRSETQTRSTSATESSPSVAVRARGDGHERHHQRARSEAEAGEQLSARRFDPDGRGDQRRKLG